MENGTNDQVETDAVESETTTVYVERLRREYYTRIVHSAVLRRVWLRWATRPLIHWLFPWLARVWSWLPVAPPSCVAPGYRELCSSALANGVLQDNLQFLLENSELKRRLETVARYETHGRISQCPLLLDLGTGRLRVPDTRGAAGCVVLLLEHWQGVVKAMELDPESGIRIYRTPEIFSLLPRSDGGPLCWELVCSLVRLETNVNRLYAVEMIGARTGFLHSKLERLRVLCGHSETRRWASAYHEALDDTSCGHAATLLRV
jgi:hypothetical protein